MGHLPMGTGHLPIPVPWPDRPHRFHDKLCRNALQNAVGKPPFGTSFVPGLAAVGPRVDEPVVLAVGPALRKSWARDGPENAHPEARQNQNRASNRACPSALRSSPILTTP